MNIYIDKRSGEPIYDQIFKEIKKSIITGDPAEDEQLPSIRKLANELGISFITTKRAYEELERQGFLYTMPGRGCFVAAVDKELIKEDKYQEAEGHIAKAVDIAKTYAIPQSDIIEMVYNEYKE